MFPLNLPRKLDFYVEDGSTQYIVDELMNEKLSLGKIPLDILYFKMFF